MWLVAHEIGHQKICNCTVLNVSNEPFRIEAFPDMFISFLPFSQQSLETGCRRQDCDVRLSTRFYCQKRSVIKNQLILLAASSKCKFSLLIPTP